MNKLRHRQYRDAETFAFFVTFIIILAVISAFLPEPFDQHALDHISGFLILLIGGIVASGVIGGVFIFIGRKCRGVRKMK